MELNSPTLLSHSPHLPNHRIVAKVNQLMALCGALEAKLKAAQTASGKLLEAAINHCVHPPEPLEETRE